MLLQIVIFLGFWGFLGEEDVVAVERRRSQGDIKMRALEEGVFFFCFFLLFYFIFTFFRLDWWPWSLYCNFKEKRGVEKNCPTVTQGCSWAVLARFRPGLRT